MEYIKVKWNHECDDEPVWLYSELDNNREEIRKIEIFSNGEYGYASKKSSSNNTKLSESYMPENDEINNNSEFELTKINKEEFESLLEHAMKISTKT